MDAPLISHCPPLIRRPPNYGPAAVDNEPFGSAADPFDRIGLSLWLCYLQPPGGYNQAMDKSHRPVTARFLVVQPGDKALTWSDPELIEALDKFLKIWAETVDAEAQQIVISIDAPLRQLYQPP